MKKIGSLLLACFLVLVFMVFKLASSMDEGQWEPLAGLERYYLRTDYEGMTALGHRNFWFSSPVIVLGQISGYKKVGNYLIVSKEEDTQYFLLDAAPHYAITTKALILDPLTRGQLNRKLLQLYGDSTFHLTLLN